MTKTVLLFSHQDDDGNKQGEDEGDEEDLVKKAEDDFFHIIGKEKEAREKKEAARTQAEKEKMDAGKASPIDEENEGSTAEKAEAVRIDINKYISLSIIFAVKLA